MKYTALLFVGFMYLGCATPEHTTIQAPNIIYILADDLGYGEIGAYGQEKIKLPTWIA